MEPNRDQSGRADFQSRPVSRTDYSRPMQPDITAPPATAPVIPVVADPSRPEPSVLSAPQAASPPAVTAVTTETPAVATPTPAPIITPPITSSDLSTAELAASITPDLTPQPVISQPLPTATAIPAQAAAAPRRLRTKLLLYAGVALLGVLIIAGVSFGLYKHLHHAPDVKIKSAQPVYSVDTSSADATVGATAQDQANNTRRQADIKSIQTQVEAYYAKFSYYPTTNNMADINWVKTNLPGLDQASLKDPQGSVAGLTTQPTKGRYSYEAASGSDLTGCDNSIINCNYYKLTAILSDGSQYKKIALQ